MRLSKIIAGTALWTGLLSALALSQDDTLGKIEADTAAPVKTDTGSGIRVSPSAFGGLPSAFCPSCGGGDAAILASQDFLTGGDLALLPVHRLMLLNSQLLYFQTSLGNNRKLALAAGPSMEPAPLFSSTFLDNAAYDIAANLSLRLGITNTMPPPATPG